MAEIDITGVASGFADGLTIMLIVMVALVVLGVIVFALYRVLRNNIRVYVRRGGKQYKYMGRETSDKTGKVLGFIIPKLPKYANKKIPEEYFYDEVKGLFRNKTRKAVDMKFTEDGNLVPIRPNTEEPTWKTMSNPQLEMYNNLREDAHERFNVADFWDKYGVIIGVGIVAIIIMITFIIAQDFLTTVVEQAGSSTAVCAESLSTCREICSNVATVAASSGGPVV